MAEKYCQCCGMPMGSTDEMYGKNKDGSTNVDYCRYCFENGAFTRDCTMDEMIEFCVPHMVKDHSDMTEDEARSMKSFSPLSSGGKQRDFSCIRRNVIWVWEVL